ICGLVFWQVSGNFFELFYCERLKEGIDWVGEIETGWVSDPSFVCTPLFCLVFRAPCIGPEGCDGVFDWGVGGGLTLCFDEGAYHSIRGARERVSLLMFPYEGFKHCGKV